MQGKTQQRKKHKLKGKITLKLVIEIKESDSFFVKHGRFKGKFMKKITIWETALTRSSDYSVTIAFTSATS